MQVADVAKADADAVPADHAHREDQREDQHWRVGETVAFVIGASFLLWLPIILGIGLLFG